jgi:two-component system, NtrC family, response regulator HydG
MVSHASQQARGSLIMTKGLHILVVDDDKDNANSLAEIFEMEGHTVIRAHSGKEAITAFRSRNFDVAFMDIAMPEKNGVESFVEIRKFKPKARIYMMTGYSVEGLAEQALRQGALGVLHKPFDLNKVLCILQALNPPGVIVVVEDDRGFGTMVCDMLTKHGHKVELARNSQEAAVQVRSSVPDVLILDLGLPAAAGLDACKALRQQGLLVPTIIVAASAENSQELTQGLRNTTLISVITKPYDPATLLKQLEGMAA